jgi:putative phosphoribosyl transferase
MDAIKPEGTAAGTSGAVVVELPQLHGRRDVFRDRADAGQALAAMLGDVPHEADLVLAIPAGGVPVAVPIAQALQRPLDVAVVSKITLPWNRESGYGAVALDGSVLLNEELIRLCMLSREEVERGIASTRRKVERRMHSLRRDQTPLDLRQKALVVVDDGLASGFTMRAALAAIKRAGARRLTVAVPTANPSALARIRQQADFIVCANLREGASFAVADAYQTWSDVPEASAEIILERARIA